MKNLLIFAIISIFLLLIISANSSGGSDNRGELYALANEIEDLESELSDMERCRDEYQYAIEAAKMNLESGYYQDAYLDLDGIEPFCLY